MSSDTPKIITTDLSAGAEHKLSPKLSSSGMGFFSKAAEARDSEPTVGQSASHPALSGHDYVCAISNLFANFANTAKQLDLHNSASGSKKVDYARVSADLDTIKLKVLMTPAEVEKQFGQVNSVKLSQ